METVDVTQMTREELENAVIEINKAQMLRAQRIRQQEAMIKVLEGQVEYLGDKLLQIRELTK